MSYGMRRIVVVLLTLAACTEAAVVLPPDAGPVTPDASEPDASVEAAAGFCPGADAALACAFGEKTCGDGGVVYECGGIGCPTGDVGSCSLIDSDGVNGHWSTLCCERRACVRTYDSWCNPDGGTEQRWLCPLDAPRPSSKCRFELGTPPDAATAAQLCCQP